MSLFSKSVSFVWPVRIKPSFEMKRYIPGFTSVFSENNISRLKSWPINRSIVDDPLSWKLSAKSTLLRRWYKCSDENNFNVFLCIDPPIVGPMLVLSRKYLSSLSLIFKFFFSALFIYYYFIVFFLLLLLFLLPNVANLIILFFIPFAPLSLRKAFSYVCALRSSI